MNDNFTIKETDIYKLILRELNNNAFGIKFNYADWFVDSVTPNEKSLMINQYALSNERFDIIESFDEETYSTKKTSVVAVNIPVLNGEPLPLKEIKEWVYSPRIEFLVSIESEKVAYTIMTAIEQIRGRLIQYQTKFDGQYFDLDNPNNPNKISETFTAIIASGGIEKGGIETFNGYKYMTLSLELTIVATNMGLFGNQEKVVISNESITNLGVPIKFEIPLIDWYIPNATDMESAQMLVDRSVGLRENAKEVKSIPKSQASTLSCTFYMDLKNQLLRDFYKKNRKPSLVHDLYTITVETYEYNETTKQYELASDLTFERVMYLNSNAPTEPTSKGERVVWNTTFVPAMIK